MQCCNQDLAPDTYRCPKCYRVLDPNDPLRPEREQRIEEWKEQNKQRRLGLVKNQEEVEDDALLVILKKLQTAIRVEAKRHRAQVSQMSDEIFYLRAALNDLAGAIINKKIQGLEEDLEEARAVLEFKE